MPDWLSLWTERDNCWCCGCPQLTVPWELLYVDDLVVIAETEDDLIQRLNEWEG